VRAALCNISDWPLTYIEGLRDMLLIGSPQLINFPGLVVGASEK
jgi:hypothetical protein